MKISREEFERIRTLSIILIIAPIIYAAVGAYLVFELVDTMSLFQVKQLPPFTDTNLTLYMILLLGFAEAFFSTVLSNVIFQRTRTPISAVLGTLVFMEAVGIFGLLEIFVTILMLDSVIEPAFFVICGFLLIAISAVLMIMYYFTTITKLTESLNP